MSLMSFRKGYLHLALNSLRTSRTRSFMTMLGIVISVSAVILIISIGQGVKAQITHQATRYGKDVLIVRPNSQSTQLLLGSGLPGGASVQLNDKDLEQLRQVGGIDAVAPISIVQGAIQADRRLDSPLVLATSPELDQILNQRIEYGGFFTASDDPNTVVLGSTIARQLFDDSAPLGQKLTFRGREFVVAGVFKQFTAPPLSLDANFNAAVFIPYDTARDILGSAPAAQEALVKTKTDANLDAVAIEADKQLTALHGGTQDLRVITPRSLGGMPNQTLDLLTVMILGVAAIALLVGGVGIMNMMLVSVTERIHEIGLRKAIGAKNGQIMRQFVTEAFTLCSVGAVLGVAVAFVTIGLLRLYTSLQPVIVWPVVVATPVVALLIGLFFGSVPALKAARMDPIEALRHE